MVYRVVRVEDGASYAAKVLADAYRGDPDVVARFRREVGFQQGLEHPNIMRIISSHLDDDPPWFVLPLARGSLLDVVLAGMSEADIEAMFGVLLSAMEYAHGRGVLHRDLKPENVLVMEDGTFCVSDFGLGKNLLGASTILTKTTIGAGSFPYAAPEQARDLASADFRSDIYSLGKLLQAALTRELPVLYDDPNVPAKYRFFINKCTEQRPQDRFQSVADAASAFDQVRRGIERPEAPREELDRIVGEWRVAAGDARLRLLRDLDALLQRHSENVGFYLDKVPWLPAELLEQYVRELPGDFRRMLGVYDEDVSGGLPFDYCDVVANFYRSIYSLTDDLPLRRRLLRRLVDMGAYHNRFYVGGVVAGILSTITETSEILMAADVLRQAGDRAAFFEGYARDLPIAAPIRDALRTAKRDTAEA